MPQIPVPLIRGHLQCRDTFAWPDRCPYKTGSAVMQNSLALSDPKIAQNSKTLFVCANAHVYENADNNTIPTVTIVPFVG